MERNNNPKSIDKEAPNDDEYKKNNKYNPNHNNFNSDSFKILDDNNSNSSSNSNKIDEQDNHYSNQFSFEKENEHNYQIISNDNITANNSSSSNQEILVNPNNNDLELTLHQLIKMVDNTKYLNDEFNPGEFKTKRDLLNKNLEVLETFTNVETEVIKYINTIQNLSSSKKQDIENLILKKFKDNFTVAIKNNVFIKETDKLICEEFNKFSHNFEKEYLNIKKLYSLDLTYQKLDPNNAEMNAKITEELKLVENDLFVSLEIKIRKAFEKQYNCCLSSNNSANNRFINNKNCNISDNRSEYNHYKDYDDNDSNSSNNNDITNLNIKKLPLFMLFQYKNYLREKVTSDFENNYEIPVKKVKMLNNETYVFLTNTFRELIDDKINLFDEKYFTKKERFLIFELMIISNLEYVRENEYSKQTLYNNSKKYFYLFNINDRFIDIMNMYSIYFDKKSDMNKEDFESEGLDLDDSVVTQENINNNDTQEKSKKKSSNYFNKFIGSVKNKVIVPLKNKINKKKNNKEKKENKESYNDNKYNITDDNNDNDNINENHSSIYLERRSLINEMLFIKFSELEKLFYEEEPENFSIINKKFIWKKFVIMIFSISIISNNLMTYSLNPNANNSESLDSNYDEDNVNNNSNNLKEDSYTNFSKSNSNNNINQNKDYKITFQPTLKVSARERQFLLNFLSKLKQFTNIPDDFDSFKINNLLEHYIFNVLIKSYSKYLFDDNNSKKVILEKEDLLNKIYETVSTDEEDENSDTSVNLIQVQNDFYNFTENEVSFVKEEKDVVLKLTNSVKSLVNFIGNKIGFNKKEKQNLDINSLKLIPYELMNTSTSIYLFIGGLFIGNKKIDNTSWKKLFPLDKTVDLYNFQWQNDSLYGLGYYLLSLIPKSYGITDSNYKSSKEDFLKLQDSINNNILFLVKEKETALKNKSNSEVFGKILAYILASRNVFNFQTINLIGYSLGASVIKHCLKELYKMSEYNIDMFSIIQNIVFISGATDINNTVDDDWSEVIELVAGKVFNIYNEKDFILGIPYKEFCEETPIGVKPLVINKKNKFTNIVKNVDMGYLNLNHFDYPDYYSKIEEEIKLE